ncbi:MAG: hypothetical protein GX800_12265, partial [Clostridiaceae bacterium]|nr:hypothetical protein [Clostridiaceae bacterium]
MMNWAKPKRDETKKSGWAKGISIDEGKNITLPLATTDGQKFGEVSYNAYKAIENNTIDSYQPINDAEKSTIDKYKNYIVTKATELQNKKLEEYKQNPTFIKYGIDPLEFDMKAFEKWADEHNFVYSTQADTWIPKREGDFLNIWGTGGRNLATEEDMNELPKLQTLAGQNERLKKADGKSAGFLSFIDSVSLGLIPKLTDLIEEELHPTVGLNDYILDDRRVKMTDYIAQAKQDQPVAGTIGSVAGALVPLAGVGGAVAKATKGVKWIASTPKWVQGAINSGITFSVISGTETGIKGGTPEEILRNAGINLVGGAVGGSLSGIVGGIGQKILFDKSLQHKLIPEMIRSGISSTAFAGGKTLSTYWLYPDEYKPSAQQITQDLLTAFAFGAIKSAINVSKMSRQNKTYLDNLYKKMGADYENMARANVSSKSDVTGIKRLASNVIEYTKQIEAYLTGKGYKSIIDGKEYSFSPNKIRLVGQDKYVKSILNDLNTIKTHANAVLNGMPTGTTDVATTTPPATGAIAPTSNVATPAAETVSPPPVVNAPIASQPVTNEFDELMATDISDVKPGDVYIKKDTVNKITVVDETDKAVKIEVDTGKSTTVRDISISQAERLKGDEFEKQPTAVNEMALKPETPITADEVIPEQTDTSSGEVITLSTPKNKKDFSINTKQYNLFKNAKKIVIGNDIITDGYIAIPKTEEVLGDINKIDNANVTSNDKMSLGKFYDGSNSVVLSGDPKLYEREVEEYVDGTKTGKKILQKSYVFKVGDKLYGVQQKYLDAFNNGKNTFLANETNPTRPIAVMDGDNLVGVIMPVRVEHLQNDFDSLINTSTQIAEKKALAQAKKAEIESRPVDNKTLKEFMEWRNVHYFETGDGKIFVTNGHFLMPTDRNGLEYILQKNHEKNTNSSKIEAVKNESLRSYIENHNATYELTEQPILQENTYIYTDGSKYFGYNKRYVDMFKKDGNRFFVNTTTDNLNDQFLVVKNTSDEVVGIVMPIKLADNIA